MSRLKNRTQFIPNGFWFIDPQISPEQFGSTAWDFETLCQQVQKRRQQNPRFNLPTGLDSIRNEVDTQNAARMQHMKGASIYLMEGSPPNDPSPNREAPRNRSLLGVVGGVKQVASGIGVLLDWLGSGAQPVTASVAESRAGVCETCPKNQPGDIFSIFTQPVANKIREQLKIRKEMNLTTTHDAKLHICSACHCPLQLKPHVPISHIAAHLSEDDMRKLDPRCWILSELPNA